MFCNIKCHVLLLGQCMAVYGHNHFYFTQMSQKHKTNKNKYGTNKCSYLHTSWCNHFSKQAACVHLRVKESKHTSISPAKTFSGSWANALAISFTQHPQSLLRLCWRGTNSTDMFSSHSWGGDKLLPSTRKALIRFSGMPCTSWSTSDPLSESQKNILLPGAVFVRATTQWLLPRLTLMYIFATPVLPSDAGVAFSIINFATPLTHNPKGGRYSDVLGWK